MLCSLNDLAESDVYLNILIKFTEDRSHSSICDCFIWKQEYLIVPRTMQNVDDNFTVGTINTSPELFVDSTPKCNSSIHTLSRLGRIEKPGTIAASLLQVRYLSIALMS
jgi:hypothetical protein